MKFVALVSGGKDSCYNILHCIANGHELAAIANLHPVNTEEQELDSFMFQTVGHDIVSFYPQCMDENIPLFRQPIKAKTSKNVELNYMPTAADEIEELFSLLSRVKTQIPDIQGVSVGAILSSYQRTRVEDVCGRLGLTCLSYLWQRNQLELMQEMCSISKTEGEGNYEGMPLMDARLIKVAAVGLDNSHLGKSLVQVFPNLLKLNKMYDVHICGEGGEFETMVLDAPFFTRGYLKIKNVVYLNEDGTADGVFNAKLDIEVVPRQIDPNLNVSEILNSKLIKPKDFDLKWNSLIESLKEEVFEDETCNLQKLNIAEPENVTYDYNLSLSKVGDKLYISNLQPDNIEDSVEDQCQNVFQKLSDVFEKEQIQKSQVLSTSLLLSDMSNFAKVNKIYNNFFNVWNEIGPLPPSRSCVGSDLIKASIQISCIVDMDVELIKTDSSLVLNKSKSGLHVQGRSYWCPCNIGPYSQATWNSNDHNQITFISGQIPLVAPSMEMINNGKTLNEKVEQCVLSLRHFDTLKTTINAKNQVSMVCYTTDPTMVPIISKSWKLYAAEMAMEDEQWFEKEDDKENCLTIVLVSQLPRNALCEWGGVACKSFAFVEDMYDSDEETDYKSPILTKDIQQMLNTFGISIKNGQREKSYLNMFFNSLEDLKKVLSIFEKLEYQATLYYSANTIKCDLNPKLEFYPVKQVYDYNGKKQNFSLQMRTIL